MSYIIETLSAENKQAWDAFVESCSEATFFHKAGWQRVIAESFGHPTYFVCAIKDNDICGVLPLVHVKSWLFGNALISNAFCVAGGPVAVNDSARVALIDHAKKLLLKTGAHYLEFRDCPHPIEHWQRRDDIHATFMGPIEREEEANLKQIPRKQRAVVRKALRATDLHSQIDENVDRIYNLYALNVRNHGTPAFAKEYFVCLKDEFAEDCEVLTITADGVPLSSVLFFYFRDTVLPFYTGGTMEARRRGANDLMYWAVMRRAVERGVQIFDFGRSRKGSGPYSFKRNWGFEPRPVTHYYFPRDGYSVPYVNPDNPKYQMLVKVWRRLPLPLANLLGPPIIRQIG